MEDGSRVSYSSERKKTRLRKEANAYQEEVGVVA
jgi:hypothetical protein